MLCHNVTKAALVLMASLPYLASAAEKKLFQCSELDHIYTPVDVGYKTDGGYVIRRYDENAVLVGTLKLSDEEVDFQTDGRSLSLKSKSAAGPVYVEVLVRGHNSILVIKSPEINVSRPRAGSVVCTF